jgi:hypothetical protein
MLPEVSVFMTSFCSAQVILACLFVDWMSPVAAKGLVASLSVRNRAAGLGWVVIDKNEN